MSTIKIELIHRTHGAIAIMHSEHVPGRKDLINYNGETYEVKEVVWTFPRTVDTGVQLIIEEVCS